jgi:tetratricopeptide (TPR) repeat protein
MTLMFYVTADNAYARSWTVMPGDPPQQVWVQKLFYGYLSDECDRRKRLISHKDKNSSDPWIWYLHGLLGFIDTIGHCNSAEDKRFLAAFHKTETREANFRHAIKLAPDFEAAWAGLIHHYLALGDIEQAQDTFTQALRQLGEKPGPEITNAQAVLEFLRGHYEKTITLIRPVLANPGIKIDSRFHVGPPILAAYSYQKLGDCNAALQVTPNLPCDVLHRAGPLFSMAYRDGVPIITPESRGVLYSSTGENIRLLEERIRRGKGSDKIHMKLAELYLQCLKRDCELTELKLTVNVSLRYYYQPAYEIPAPYMSWHKPLPTGDYYHLAQQHIAAAEKLRAPELLIAILRMQAADNPADKINAIRNYLNQPDVGLYGFAELVNSEVQKGSCDVELVELFRKNMQGVLQTGNGVELFRDFNLGALRTERQAVASAVEALMRCPEANIRNQVLDIVSTTPIATTEHLSVVVMLAAKQDSCDERLIPLFGQYIERPMSLSQRAHVLKAIEKMSACTKNENLRTKIQGMLVNNKWIIENDTLLQAPPHQVVLLVPDIAENGAVIPYKVTGDWDIEVDRLVSVEVFARYPRYDNMLKWVATHKPHSTKILPYFAGRYRGCMTHELVAYVECERHGKWALTRPVKVTPAGCW